MNYQVLTDADNKCKCAMASDSASLNKQQETDILWSVSEAEFNKLMGLNNEDIQKRQVTVVGGVPTIELSPEEPPQE